jgi:cell division protein FtsI (penicillin-binding protein 3)
VVLKDRSIRERKKKEARIWLHFRLRIILVVFLILFAALLIRVAKLMLVNREALYSYAEKQHRIISTYTTKRGNIYDVNGMDLAVSLEMDSVYACPYKITDPRKTARLVARTLSMDEDDLYKRITSDKNFVWIKRTVSPKTAESVKDLKLEGIGFVNEDRRFFPNRNLCSHVIGFVGTDSQGLAGIEYEMDRYLKSTVSHFIAVRDARGNSLFAVDPADTEALKRYDVYLTIDTMVQYIVERELTAAIEQYQAEGGCVIVMNPNSGEVIAMASRPDYDPNRFLDAKRPCWNNRAVTMNFEPGSTLKIFLAAGVIEEGLAKRDDRFNCEGGTYQIDNVVFHDHGVSYDALSFSDIVRYSSNIGAIKLGRLLGPDKLFSYLGAFGFGEPTGITLPGEEVGMIMPKSSVRPVDLASMSFGQGLSVTPLQLITAASVIANGGLLMEPYLVDRIVDENGDAVVKTSPKIKRRVISPETARMVTEMMEGVVASGTGVYARVAGFDVAGKTGTAEVYDPATRTYSETVYTASFVGFLPAKSPRLIILVVLENPHTSIYGGDVAAPVFKNIAGGLMKRMTVNPDGTYHNGSNVIDAGRGSAEFAPLM